MLVGAQNASPRKADADQEDILVPGGNKVLVIKSEVKLVMRNA